MKNYIYLFVILAFISCEEIEPSFFEKEFLGKNADYSLIDADAYTGIPSEKREFFLYEEFNDNQNGWQLTSTSTVYTAISDGNYIMQAGSSASISSIVKAIDTNRNFEIETNIKIVNPQNTNASGIAWGYSSNNTEFYSYLFSSNQSLWIGYYQWNNYNTWLDFTQQNVNPQNQYNKLTIRKINSEYYFFMNEAFIMSQNFETFFDSGIGFLAASYSTIYIDYLNIDYIN